MKTFLIVYFGVAIGLSIGMIGQKREPVSPIAGFLGAIIEGFIIWGIVKYL